MKIKTKVISVEFDEQDLIYIRDLSKTIENLSESWYRKCLKSGGLLLLNKIIAADNWKKNESNN